ncbi:MAG: hypothetical protein R6U46_11385 [Marinilabilia sp.]
MYIILIQYKTPDNQVQKEKKVHDDFIKEQIEKGNFITAGQRNPNTGEVILSCLQDIEVLHDIICRDPYFKTRKSHFEIIEFSPQRSCSELEEFFQFQEDNH